MSNRTCLVVGATGGIGRALCPVLLRQGWSLVLAGRSAEPLHALAQELGASSVVLDARDPDAVEALFADTQNITGAVNLAGSILLKPAHLTSADDFAHTLSLNLTTAFAITRAAGKHMRAAGGSVVLVSSCAASIGLANHEAISAAKAGVEGLMRAAAATYAPAQIRFNAVAPGLVDTPLASRMTSNEASLKASTAMHPIGRIGRAEDVAHAIAFLLQPSSDWITGQVLGVDGGLSRLKLR